MNNKGKLHDSIGVTEAQVISIDHPQALPTVNENAFDVSGEVAGIAGFSNTQVEFLKSLGFTKGLVEALADNYRAFKKRVWLVDNSGSMKMMDGQQIVFDDGFCKCLFVTSEPGQRGRVTKCSRWEELQSCVEYHTEMSGQLQIPTLFRVLNAPDRRNPHIDSSFEIGNEKHEQSHAAFSVSRRVMAIEPQGPTPLAMHLRRIRRDLDNIADELESSGQKVVIIIATDGIPTNERGYTGKEITQDFVNALNQVYKYPVWIIFRLCTNNLEVIEYYNGLDRLLERPVEVLNDFMDEAAEVHKCNPWINYATPLHRCREFGFHHRLFDLIDERALSLDEMVDFCALLFGDEMRDAPDPRVQWNAFIDKLKDCMTAEGPQWSPSSKSVKPWINLSTLNYKYGKSGSGCTVV